LVKSSNIKSIGFDHASNILEIDFLSGGVYQYFKVPSQIYLSLMKAASKGSYFHNNIRGIYEYRRVT